MAAIFPDQHAWSILAVIVALVTILISSILLVSEHYPNSLKSHPKLYACSIWLLSKKGRDTLKDYVLIISLLLIATFAYSLWKEKNRNPWILSDQKSERILKEISLTRTMFEELKPSIEITCFDTISFCARLEILFSQGNWKVTHHIEGASKPFISESRSLRKIEQSIPSSQTKKTTHVIDMDAFEVTSGINLYIHSDSSHVINEKVKKGLYILGLDIKVHQADIYDDFLIPNHYWIVLSVQHN